MNILHNKPLADHLEFTDANLVIYLKDARVLSVPLAWFPRLLTASKKQLKNYELLGDGEGIHWPDIDEDLSVSGLLFGVILKVA